MNKFMRFIGILLAAMLLCPAVSAADEMSTANNTTRAGEALVAIGIVDICNENDIAVRRKFAVYLTRMMRLADVKCDTEVFKDVPAEDENFDEIGFMAETGILNGYSDGKFYPDSSVLAAQAVKALVGMSGYDSDAQASGGYPMGYMAVAGNIGILNGISVSANEELTYEKLYGLIFNTLDVKVRIQTSFGDKYVYKKMKDHTFLSEMLGLKKVKGVVSANGITSFAESGIGKGYVKIDNEIYSEGKTNVSEMLGYSITAYVDENDTAGEGTILYAYKTNGKNKEMNFESDDIENETTRDRLVYSSNDRIKSESIKNAYVVYNGRISNDVTDKDFRPYCGTVTILDNNDDGNYEVVFITSYDVEITQSATSDLIFAKYTGNRIPTDSKDMEVAIYRYGSKIESSEISEWSVLNILYSKDGKYCDIYVTDDKRTGTALAIDDESITIGEAKAEFSKVYFKNLALPDFIKAEAGKKYSAYLDMYGKVVALKNMEDNAYGYIIKVSEQDKMGSVYIIKMLIDEGERGEVKNFKTEENFRIDGEKCSDITKNKKLFDPVKHKIVRQLVIYTLNDKNEITKIITAKDKANKYLDDEETVLNPDYEENYCGYTENEFTYDDNIPTAAYRAGSCNTFESLRYKVAYTTKTFIVSDAESAKDEDFRVYPFTYYKGDTTYQGSRVYDVNADCDAGILVVNTNADTASGTDSVMNSEHMVIVKKIAKSINSDGDTVDTLCGMHLGKYVEYPSAKEDLRDEGGAWNREYYGIKLADLPCGSAVQVARNSRGEITDMRILYIPGSMEFYKERRETGNGNVSMYNTSGNLYTAYGRVIKHTKNSVIFNAHSDGVNAELDGTIHSWDRNLTCTSTYIYLCDLTENKVKVMHHNDIRPGDIIFLQRCNGALVALAIYR